MRVRVYFKEPSEEGYINISLPDYNGYDDTKSIRKMAMDELRKKYPEKVHCVQRVARLINNGPN